MMAFWILSGLALLVGVGVLIWALLSVPHFDEVDDRESLYDDWGL